MSEVGDMGYVSADIYTSCTSYIHSDRDRVRDKDIVRDRDKDRAIDRDRDRDRL